MPAASGSRRCAFVDEGTKCRRIGFGNPPLCRAHVLMLEVELDSRDPLRGMLEDFDRRLSKIFGHRKAADVGNAFTALLARQIAAGRRAAAEARERQAQQQHQARRRPVDSGRFADRSAPRPPPGPPPPPPPPPTNGVAAKIVAARMILNLPPTGPLSAAMVKERRRQLAKVFHPDTGGDKDAMARVNQAADLLLSKLP